ncbi:MAG: LytTR family transcriptional regulator [Bacteroidales bacterium]|nr:LytTR family transcriptional regulator [Bacteroidales bacterium]
MNNPFLTSIPLRYLYIGIWVIVIVTQIAICNYFFISYSPQSIVTDSIVCSILQAVCLLALWYPVRYYRSVLSIPLFLLFHLLLVVLSFSIWLGLGYLFSSLILSHDGNYTYYFLTLLPVRIVFGILVYIIFILTYYLFLSTREIHSQQQQMEEVESTASQAPVEPLTRISVKKSGAIHFIPVNQVLYIEANGDYVLIYTKETKFLKDRTMKYWENHLPAECFVRIHRSFIVNLEYIDKIELYEKDSYRVQLKGYERSLKVSNSGYKLLKQKIQ